MGELALNWSREDYERDTMRLRSTQLKVMVTTPQGPAAFRRLISQQRDDDDDDDESRTFVLGRLLHEWLLEQQINFHVTKHRRNTKAWLDEADEHAPKLLINDREHKQLVCWYDAVMRNDQAKRLLSDRGRFAEVTIVWDELVDEVVIPCKCRIDWLTSSGTIVDLKTSSASTRGQFHEQIMQYGYDFSAAFYARGLNSVPEFALHHVTFLHLVVCKDGWSYLWPLSPKFMSVGKAQVERALRDYAECVKREAQGLPEYVAWPDRQAAKQSVIEDPKEWYVAQAHLSASRPLGLDEYGDLE